MKSINDIRRDNLRDIINSDFEGKQVRLANAMKLTPNLVSRWLKPSFDTNSKNIGDAAARKIEETARKPKYWLDTDHVMAIAAGDSDDGVITEIGEVAAHNLEMWMLGNRDLKSQARVAEKAGVSQSTVNRLLKKEASISINNLASIASVFGRRPYELLVPPRDESLITYDRSQYAKLPNEEKAKIESFIEFILSQNQKRPEE
ncbi:helix-turn-helix domain-containing protein [Yersinia massiliensis]|uniref:helix-turn-helix domain-containing protein n=1 Tax=Yersinia massiliensis TaxID=419257 RepID=UPI00119EEEBE|nr:helix-turn-helix transcriptional regulator [Yersinia massiliensis]